MRSKKIKKMFKLYENHNAGETASAILRFSLRDIFTPKCTHKLSLSMVQITRLIIDHGILTA